MSLITLPSEILQDIIREVGPQDLENIALTCKHIYVKSGDVIRSYNKLIKKLRHVSLEADGSYGSSESGCSSDEDSENAEDDTPELGQQETEEPVAQTNRRRFGPGIYTRAERRHFANPRDLVILLGKNPRLQRYVRSLDLRTTLPWDYDLSGVNWDLEPLSATDLRVLHDITSSSTYLLEAKQDPDQWARHIEECDSTSAEQFLLTLLPELVELTPPTYWSDGEMNHALMPVIVKRANTKAHSASLSKLEIVRPSGPTDYDTKHTLSAYAPFMSIKSVRSFHGASCCAWADEGPSWDDPPTGPWEPNPNLERLELAYGLLSGGEFTKCLRLTPNLKCLRVQHTTKYHGCGSNWNAGSFLGNVQREVGNVLEELCLAGGDINNTISTLGSLTGFSKLKVLEIEADFLTEYEWLPVPAGEDVDDECDVGEKVNARLVDYLPRSLEVLHLHFTNRLDDEYHAENFLGLLDGFVDEHEVKLSNLKRIKIFIHHYGPWMGPPEHRKTRIDQDPKVGALYLDLHRRGLVVFPCEGETARWIPGFMMRFGLES